ncbi:EAL domain-containing protein [Aliiglaciecola sp. LCG003]|uniref:EAL domain-containing protein n=1 Tax=Aliiglaciecola sp. LCG003 TaxID=3053655 RepID=UPI0025729F0F|nr:EAL domain-containing protein [Aliiglaciecola sp. LCG003]WJG09632.1 EAL domain-containing protein [Aliiglaciecola sp. LCG003]
MDLVRVFSLAVCIAFAALSSHAWADVADKKPIRLEQSTQHLELHSYSEVLLTNKRSQLSQVQAMQGWTTNWNTAPMGENQAMWVRFSFEHIDNKRNNYFVVVGNPSINFLDAYILDEKNRILESYLVGAKREITQRPFSHRNFVLPLTLDENQLVSVYLRIRDDGPSTVALDLWSENALIAEEQFRLAFIGVISGALAILFFYFLITYVILRSPTRFWFAIANASLLMLFLNINGVVTQLTGLGAYSAHISSLLIAITIFTAAKVSHNLLVAVPIYWRFISYMMAIALVVVAPTLNSYWQIIVASALTAAAVLLHLLLALIYHHREHPLANRLYIFGWLIISAISMLNVSLYLSGAVLPVDYDLISSFLVMTGVLLIAVAIESHEQNIIRVQHTHQQTALADLRQFYDLFKNSAEGLYTSTIDGKLVTTNPAMCQLFGFENEAQMLAEVQDTSQLYANPQQRDGLLNEIFDKGMVLGREIKGIRRDASEFWFCISVQLTRNGDDEFFFGSIFDVTEKKQSSISLEYLATHDSLTGVYNRREFEQKLRDGIRRAKQLKQDLTLLYMDLDQFKVVNDTCGHKAGDVLIKQLSQILSDVVAGKGVLARLGGDEFGVILEAENTKSAHLLASQVLNVVKEFRFVWENRMFTTGISIGLVDWHDGAETPEQLMSMADGACYVAKEQGRNRLHVYSASDHKMQRYESELKWVSQINQALENDHFVLYYQHYYPLSKVNDGYHYEILLRMVGPDGEIVPPAAFLPSAERYGLTAQIDKWVIQNTFKWLSSKPAHLAKLERCNINLSGHSLADNDLKMHLLSGFEKYNIPHHKICFEITESMAIVKMEETLRFINTFRKLGCTFALDDFGSGFSSYSYLKNLPVNCVKIDGSFVRDLLIDPVDMAMVCSIKDVAKAMSMTTVAEFVESKEIMVELGKIGVDFAQGYGVAKPAPLENFVPCKTIN